MHNNSGTMFFILICPSLYTNSYHMNLFCFLDIWYYFKHTKDYFFKQLQAKVGNDDCGIWYYKHVKETQNTHMITHKTLTESVVISKRLDLRRRRLRLLRRRKYFWAWLATCVGVLVFTKFLEIPLQSPFPTFCRPNRNSLCSSSVHGTPICCSVTTKSKLLILLYNKCEITYFRSVDLF